MHAVHEFGVLERVKGYGHLNTVAGVEFISCQDLLVVSPEDYGGLLESVCVCVCVCVYVQYFKRYP